MEYHYHWGRALLFPDLVLICRENGLKTTEDDRGGEAMGEKSSIPGEAETLVRATPLKHRSIM